MGAGPGGPDARTQTQEHKDKERAAAEYVCSTSKIRTASNINIQDYIKINIQNRVAPKARPNVISWLVDTEGSAPIIIVQTNAVRDIRS